ncbi:MAG: hypothetical protein ABIC91_01015 [Nanoarchaeota archaeon]|nr:hypothetical protein [Nanoarchaeota archaeon]MBU1030924.1 hypothetical protein [Nanoarchaeota archaeon]MBU1850465.1 hypothetical protein [Nanoarchaeota archaeon]
MSLKEKILSLKNKIDYITQEFLPHKLNTKTTLGITAGTIIMLNSCYKMTEGEVYNKIYEPENSWIFLMPITMHCGKSTITTIVPMYMYDDEDFIIKIRNYDEKGKEKSKTIYLTREQYERINVEDWYIINQNEERFSDNHERRKATREEQKTLEQRTRG